MPLVHPPSLATFPSQLTVARGTADRTPVTIASLHEKQPLVLLVLRRWGCMLCRGYARKMSQQLLPSLRRNNVRMVAVGFDWDGLDEFKQHGYFADNDELYVDHERNIYKTLQLTKLGALRGLGQLLTAQTREWTAEVQRMGISGNFKGDGFQLGGTFVLGTDGAVWLEHRQSDYGDLAQPDDVLRVLGSKIPGFQVVAPDATAVAAAAAAAANADATCTTDACLIDGLPAAPGCSGASASSSGSTTTACSS